jgi:hypothetical protein
MTTRRFTSVFGLFACLTIVLYGALVVLATGCAAMPLSSSDTHHHSQESTHSSICAWSCQLLSQNGLVVSAPAVAVSLAAISVVALVPHPYAASPSAPRSSRAPPLFIA